MSLSLIPFLSDQVYEVCLFMSEVPLKFMAVITVRLGYLTGNESVLVLTA